MWGRRTSQPGLAKIPAPSRVSAPTRGSEASPMIHGLRRTRRVSLEANARDAGAVTGQSLRWLDGCPSAKARPMTTAPLSFQDLILALQTFWAERGCLIVQPYN